MSIDLLRRLVDAVVRGDIEACASLTSSRWPSPTDRPTEPTPQEMWRELGPALFGAFTEREVPLDGLVEADGEVRGRVEGTFRYTGNLSKNKHARKHFDATGHPLIRAVRLHESWAWCYADGCLFSKWW
jgi:hypothetical protein